jgi:hypothetical protein
MEVVANFIWFLGVIAILSVVLAPKSQIGTALNSTGGLISTSIKAAKS